ncbi:putative nuclease HARBI1 [Aricia agestis]|uniref:putative nuclease HARBI1 n=1 Tax=Aricia agestis TaxID=91739 RepID=UPI001C20A4A8|nr:putative nuclease HARBI1 [Aricia agestis]
MSRSFLLLYLLKEANDLDLFASRRQARRVRNLPLLNRGDDYVRQYRLSEDMIEELQEELSNLVSTRTRGSLSIRLKLLCTLAFLATGSYQRIIGRNIGTFMSQPSISRSIDEIVRLLSQPSIVRKYIRFPQNSAERTRLKEKFYEKFGIPGVIGCIDGTFVAIIRPRQNEDRFYCRKGFHARNVLLITDADLNILHVDSSFGGASHDSHIFNNSPIKSHLEQLINSGETAYLLGDSGYLQRPYLMIPIANAEDNSPEEHYNKLHATARNSVERAIGVLKGRFRCLLAHRVLHYAPDVAGRIITACCVLHNMCNRAGMPAPVLSVEEARREISMQEREQVADSLLQDLNMGRAARNDLVNVLWRGRR